MTNRLVVRHRAGLPFERSVHQEFLTASSCLSIVLCREEAGFHRQAWCQMPVIVSGHENRAITHSITVGSRITVQGFISCHKAKNGLSKMVLHAEQIELIDSGD